MSVGAVDGTPSSLTIVLLPSITPVTTRRVPMSVSPVRRFPGAAPRRRAQRCISARPTWMQLAGAWLDVEPRDRGRDAARLLAALDLERLLRRDLGASVDRLHVGDRH